MCVCCDGDNAHKIFKYSCTLHKGAVDGGAVGENSKGSLPLLLSGVGGYNSESDAPKLQILR